MRSSIFINIFLNLKLKIPHKFDFRLGFSDFKKIYFAITSEYGKDSFRSEPYLHLLNNRIFVVKGFENLYCKNLSKLV